MKFSSLPSTGMLASMGLSLLSLSSMMASSAVAAPSSLWPLTAPALADRSPRDLKKDKAARELVMFSTPEGTSPSKMRDNYIYDRSAGSGIEVYIIDSGADLDHQEFTTSEVAANRARWIFVDESKDNHKNDGDLIRVKRGKHMGWGGKCHGTGMLDKVVGTKNGVAKRARPVIVKVPGARYTHRDAGPDDYLEGVRKTRNDIQARRNGDQAVVSISWYYPAAVVDAKWRSDLRRYLRAIIAEGATVVVASGNDGLRAIDGYPAALARDIPEMIVVGASDYVGERWRSASGSGSNYDRQQNLPHVYAPGAESAINGIQVANCRPGSPWQSPSGTSPATASVAGLIAYLKGHPGFDTRSPSQVKALVEDMAYARGRDIGVETVWNGVGRSSSCNVQRRDSANFTDCLDEYVDSGKAKLF